MDIKRNGAQPSSRGPTEWFTGTVRIDPLFEAHDPARAGGASVTFEPGARTMAQPPAGTDPDRNGWPWPGAALGWSHRGKPSGRRDLDCAG